MTEDHKVYWEPSRFETCGSTLACDAKDLLACEADLARFEVATVGAAGNATERIAAVIVG